MFTTIEITVAGNNETKAIIDMTHDSGIVMNAVVGVFEAVFGDKFGKAQAEKLIAEHEKDVAGLLKCNLQSGLLKFHSIKFDDNTKTMPTFKIEKN